MTLGYQDGLQTVPAAASVADFTIVDDGSGTFSPQNLLFAPEIDQLVL